MSLQRCKSETTSSELVLWMVFLEEEVNAFHREDYFLANISLRICQAFSDKPNKFKLEDFLLKFTSGERKEEDGEEMTQEEYTTRSKNAWFAGLGIKQE